jgi:bifunctional non-homologous end joining protein LigD
MVNSLRWTPKASPRFQLLQNALRSEAKLLYCIFDIMFLGGEDLRRLPFLGRIERLRGLLPKDPLLTLSEHHPQHGIRLFKETEKEGLEGLM